MKTFAVISLFASVALAQSSALVPAGISSGCSSFLTSLNSDSSLSSCTGPIITATAQFLNSSSTPSSSTVSSALNNLCGSSAQCDEATVRSKLTDFYSNCTAELTSARNSDVLALYDVFYTLIPIKQAICSKDDSGKYCVGEVSSNVPVSSMYSTVSGSGSQTVLKPNVNTFLKNNIAFLLLQSSTPAATLCTPCVRSVLTSFVSWESSSPYAPGLANSVILGGQGDLYTAVQNECGATFLQGAVQAAGTLSGGVLANGSPRTVSSNVGSLGALLGALAVAMAATL